MPYDFLSDEWIDAAHAIRERFAAEADPVPHKVRMNMTITGVPFGDGEMRIHLDTTGGQVVLERGELEGPDVTVVTDYETARSILVDQDPQAGMQAFMSGKVRIQGDVAKLLSTVQTAPPDSTARRVSDEIRAITA